MVTERSESYFSIGILLIAAVLVGLVFLPELNAIVLGISVAILFQPWYDSIKKTLHDRSGVSAAIIVVIAVAIILVPLTFFGLQIFTEAQGLYVQVASGRFTPTADLFLAAVHQWLPSLNLDIGPYIQQVLGLLISDIVTAPHRIALGNPKIKNPMPVRNPYSAAMASDPRITEFARACSRARISSACAAGNGPRATSAIRKADPSFKK